MTAIIIDVKAIAQQTRLALKRRLNQRRKQNLITPGLAVVLVGEDAASKIYVRNKRDACRDIGIHSMAYDLVQHTTELELLHLITTLNADQKVHTSASSLILQKAGQTARYTPYISGCQFKFYHAGPARYHIACTFVGQSKCQ